MHQSWQDVWRQRHEESPNSYVTCPRHLRLTMDAVLPVRQNDTVNCIYRAFLWMLYGGMDANMTIRVKVSDVDFVRMTIRTPQDYDGHIAQPIYHSAAPEPSCPIYAEAVEDLQMACSLGFFMEPGHGRQGDRCCQRADGDHVLRPKRHGDRVPDDPKRLTHTLKPALQLGMQKFLAATPADKVPAWLPVGLTPKKVETSGKYYRAAMEDSMGLLTWVDPHLTQSFVSWKHQSFQ